MALTFTNYHASAQLEGVSPKQVLILTGSTNGTIVKSLQLITGNESCRANIIRKDSTQKEYSTIKLDLKANDYLILWQGFFVIPYGHKLYLEADSLYCKTIANVVEM